MDNVERHKKLKATLETLSYGECARALLGTDDVRELRKRLYAVWNSVDAWEYVRHWEEQRKIRRLAELDER